MASRRGQVSSRRPQAGLGLGLGLGLALSLGALGLGACERATRSPGPRSERGPGAGPRSERGTGASAAEELRRFVAFVRAVHPEPDRFVDELEFITVSEAAARGLEGLEAPSELEVARAFHQALAPLGDSHLQIAIPLYQPDYAGARSLLPLQLIWLDERVFIDSSAAGWPPGTELLSIDGRDAAPLWAELEGLVLVDGHNLAARRRVLERDFGKHYHLAHGMAPDYAVTVELPDGTQEHARLAGLSPAQLGELGAHRHSAPRQGARPEAPPWPTLVSVDSTTALLRLPSFGIADQAGYAARVDALFAELSAKVPAVETLILDVRGNPGGLRTHGVAVLNHVLAAPYVQWRGAQARVQNIPKAYRGQVQFLFGSESLLAEYFPRGARFDGDPLAERMKPTGPGFGGELVVFADGLTNSAANEFVLALEAARPGAVLIGEEIGGDCDRHVGELPLVYTSADFGVVVLLSLIGVEHVAVPGCEPGRGLAPDREIRYGVTEFLNGVDPFMVALTEG